MREVNFSIPNVNKASVGITTALYDRRALDCTSTLPLINSLNHLAYLTTSSARIRDILTVDGGVERLVCILKAGRSKDMLDMWKWNLAFQCVVNIGVRGSENVRTRVVEADMVPVIATILDNYLQVVDRCREKAEAEAKRNAQRALANEMHAPATATRSRDHPRGASLASRAQGGSGNSNSSSAGITGTATNHPGTGGSNGNNPGQAGGSHARTTGTSITTSTISAGNGTTTTTANTTITNTTAAAAAVEQRSSRRQAPPPSIAIPRPPFPYQPPLAARPPGTVPFVPRFAITAPPERINFIRPPPHPHRRSPEGRSPFHSSPTSGPSRLASVQSAAALTPMNRPERSGLRPVRDVDRLPSMVPGALTGGLTSQPESPTTPHPLPPIRSPTVRPLSATIIRARRRPSIRHQGSMSGESDDAQGDEGASDGSAGPETAAAEPIVDIRPGEMDDREGMLTTVDAPLELATANASETQEVETFNITHRSAVDGSIINPTPNPAGTPLTISPAAPTVALGPPGPAIPSTNFARYLLDRPSASGVLVAMPRDEDVLMSLQLLAYVSKYCNLRSYFQQSHLVPKLKIGKELSLLDGKTPREPGSAEAAPKEEEEEEYLLPDDFNIFPLVEKFTVRHHSSDMQYWAGVVMRNLCRKDDARGGIRQCAYYQCGKWEKYTRQFAKCRRCRRTKYCSKECQKSAWVYHRHWCIAAQAQAESTG